MVAVTSTAATLSKRNVRVDMNAEAPRQGEQRLRAKGADIPRRRSRSIP